MNFLPLLTLFDFDNNDLLYRAYMKKRRIQLSNYNYRKNMLNNN